MFRKYGGHDRNEHFAQANWKFTKESDGTAQAITGSAYADGKYTLTGVGLVTGFLTTDGVIEASGEMFEGVSEKVTI